MTTRIPWADETWNPFLGCTHFSAGCENCYAERFAGRELRPEMQGLTVSTDKGRRWSGVVKLLPERLAIPGRWSRKPKRIFVGSMGDLFHDRIPVAFIDQVVDVIREAPHHVFIVLTKRADRAKAILGDGRQLPSNLEMGVTVEDQAAFDSRVPRLLEIPATIRFLSCEPVLELIDLRLDDCLLESDHYTLRDRLGGVIVGGETGPGARETPVRNVRRIVEQCDVAGVAAYVKQLGARPTWYGSEPFEWPPRLCRPNYRVKLRDRAGADPEEWPKDLRRRVLPREVVIL